jgi:hypothetical protein
MAVRLSALLASSPLPLSTPRKIPGTHFYYRLSRTQAHSEAGWIRSIKKSNDLTGNRTRDLPAFSNYQLRYRCKNKELYSRVRKIISCINRSFFILSAIFAPPPQPTSEIFYFSMALPAHSVPRPRIQFRNHFSQTIGLLGRVIRPLLKHRTTQTQNKRIHTSNIHVMSGIRTHDTGVRAS